MNIVINCDDLGIRSDVNASIFRQMEKGLVRSATVMMNGAAVEEAIREAQNFPHCSFGVHLNITQFATLSNHPGLAPLLDAQGEFNGRQTGRPYRIPLTKAIRAGVFAEWSAQIERARALGLRISHIDSHHHTHTRWELLGELTALCSRYGITRVRTRVNVGRSFTFHLLNRAWNRRLRAIPGITTTAGFAAFTTFHQRLVSGQSIPETMEVMCHPGHDRYRAENILLDSNWEDRLPVGTTMVSYREIGMPEAILPS